MMTAFEQTRVRIASARFAEMEKLHEKIAKLETEVVELRKIARQSYKGWTVFMYVTDDGSINFYRIQGNYMRLNEVFINSTDNEDRQLELGNLLWTDEGVAKKTPLSVTEVRDTIRRGAILITCGQV